MIGSRVHRTVSLIGSGYASGNDNLSFEFRSVPVPISVECLALLRHVECLLTIKTDTKFAFWLEYITLSLWNEMLLLIQVTVECAISGVEQSSCVPKPVD